MSTTDDDILAAVRRGMRQALNDATRFSEDFAASIKTEYLVTVNIAHQLAEHCPLVGQGDLRVALEKKTRDFAKDALPLMKGDGTFRGGSVLRRHVNATRNGRVDIAVSKGAYARSYCAIEVKGFGPPPSLVKKDLKRNIEFLLLEGPTGRSSVAMTVFCAYFDCKDTFHESDIQPSHQRVEQYYRAITDALPRDTRVVHHVEVFDAGSETITPAHTQDDFENMTVHHFAGIMIVSRRIADSVA